MYKYITDYVQKEYIMKEKQSPSIPLMDAGQMAQSRRLYDLWNEFRNIVIGRSNLLDAILPVITFLILKTWITIAFAMWGSLVLAAIITLYRILRKQAAFYTLFGLFISFTATLSAILSGYASLVFLPDLLTGSITIVLSVTSLAIKRPVVALTSHLTRNWPLNWYWHPQVRPAYRDVTWIWVVYFTLRLAFQVFLLRTANIDTLSIANFLMGWPAMIALLIVSYLYGVWRLNRLQGPSIEEFTAGVLPPWKSQQKGF